MSFPINLIDMVVVVVTHFGGKKYFNCGNRDSYIFDETIAIFSGMQIGKMSFLINRSEKRKKALVIKSQK